MKNEPLRSLAQQIQLTSNPFEAARLSKLALDLLTNPLCSQSDAELRAILLTVDGKGKIVKEGALDELLRREMASYPGAPSLLVRDYKGY
jgi:hypothetical protein